MSIIHNTFSLLSTHIEIFWHICFGLLWPANGSWFVHISLLIQTRWPFHCGKQYGKRTLILARSNSLKLNLLIINIQCFASENINWWTGVVSFTCRLCDFFYQLFGLILTAPIHCRWSIGEQVISFSKSIQTHLHLGLSEGDEIVCTFTFLSELFN